MLFSTTVWSWLGSFIKAENELTGRIGHSSFPNIFTYKPFVYVMMWAITKSEVSRCHQTVSQKTFIHCWPCGSDQAGEQSPLLGIGELHDSRSLDFLTDPLTLVHVVDEHELDPYVTAVGRLKKKEHGAVVLLSSIWDMQGHKHTNKIPPVCVWFLWEEEWCLLHRWRWWGAAERSGPSQTHRDRRNLQYHRVVEGFWERPTAWQHIIHIIVSLTVYKNICRGNFWCNRAEDNPKIQI